MKNNFKLRPKPREPYKRPLFTTKTLWNWRETMTIAEIKNIIKDIPDDASIDFCYERHNKDYGLVEFFVIVTTQNPDDGSFEIEMEKYKKKLKEWNDWNKKHADEIAALKKERAAKKKENRALIRELQKEIEKLKREQ